MDQKEFNEKLEFIEKGLQKAKVLGKPYSNISIESLTRDEILELTAALRAEGYFCEKYPVPGYNFRIDLKKSKQ